MADVHSKNVRSHNMSRIRGKDTKPEMLVRKFLFAKGLRYRLHYKKMPGRPDMFFRNIKSLFLSTVAFGMGTKVAPTMLFQKPELNGG